MSKFGALLRELRMKRGVSLRDFCQQNHLDPGNFSRIERGVSHVPENPEVIHNYARILGLQPGSNEWTEFCDIAAISRGELPPDLMEDEALLEKLPVLFRTMRGTKVTEETLTELAERIRKA